MKKIVEFKIEGMHCPGCNQLIEDICEDWNTKIKFNQNIATLEFEESKIDLLELIKEIEREHFSISEIKIK